MYGLLIVDLPFCCIYLQISRAFSLSAEFFSLALEDKAKYARVGTSDNDGYVHLEKESYVLQSILVSTS